MPTTAMPTREQLEAQAAELAAQLDAHREADQRREEERHRRRAQAERNYDEQIVAAFNRRSIDADVEEAEQAMRAALAADPLVTALAGYAVALQRRRNAMFQLAQALDRTGKSSAGIIYPPADFGPIGDVLAAAVARLVVAATDADAADAADAAQHRDAATNPSQGDTP